MKIVECELSKNGTCNDNSCYHHSEHHVSKECNKTDEKLAKCSLSIVCDCVNTE